MYISNKQFKKMVYQIIKISQTNFYTVKYHSMIYLFGDFEIIVLNQHLPILKKIDKCFKKKSRKDSNI